MKQRIVFRADGGPGIGWGHVYRSLALVQILHPHFDCVFVSQRFPGFLTEALAKIAVPVLQVKEIPYPSPEQRQPGDEITFDMEHLLSKNDTVVLDGYWFGTGFQKKIKNIGARLVCIDDLHDIQFYADVIINPSWTISSREYNAIPYTKFALGPGYSLLRPSFLKAAENGSAAENDDLFLCFGGADPLGLTVKALAVLKHISFFRRVYCITGQSFNDFEGLQTALQADARIKHYHNAGEEQMAGIMMESRYGIAPASSVLVEAIACGVQCVTCYYAKNQQSFHQTVTKAGMLSAGWADENFMINLAAAVNQLITCNPAVNMPRNSISKSKENFIELFNVL
jgi:UDP-2,4-diacetamido-2,4,6-trideoxy-beta-L-altropyranose hydrolase